jgi:phosphoribosylformylglycinamidine synthase
MTRVVVEVMPKPEILDPQGQAIQKALGRLGFDAVTSVRQGKRFEVEVDAATAEDAIQAARQMAERLLANTVIEDFAVSPTRSGS